MNVAQLINGKELAAKLQQETAEQVKEIQYTFQDTTAINSL